MQSVFAPLESDDRAVFGRCGNVVLICIHDQEASSTFTLVERHLRAVAAEEGGRVGLLLLVDHGNGPPPDLAEDTRALVIRVGDLLVAASAALLAVGFAAAIHRSVAAMVLRLLGKRDFIGVHADVESAVAWLLERMQRAEVGAPTATALVTAARATRVEAARARRTDAP